MSKYKLPSNVKLSVLLNYYSQIVTQYKQKYFDGNQIAETTNWYIVNQKIKAFMENLDRKLSLCPEDAEVLGLKSFCYLVMNQLEEAKEIIKKIQDDTNPNIKIIKAGILIKEGQVASGIALLETVKDLSDLFNVYNIVRLLISIDYPQLAEKWLYKVHEVPPELNIIYLQMKLSYATAMEKQEEIINTLNEMIKIKPFCADYWYFLAYNYRKFQNIEKSIEACEFALAIDPNHVLAYTHLVGIYSNTDNEKCIKYTNKIIELSKTPPTWCYLTLANSYAKLEKWEEAAHFCEKSLELLDSQEVEDLPTMTMSFTLYIDSLIILKQFAKAHSICQLAQNKNITKEEVYLAESKLFFTEGNTEEGEHLIKELLNFNYNKEIRYKICDLYQELNYIQQEEYYLKSIFEEDPHFKNVAERLTYLKIKQNQINDECKIYNAYSKNPLGEDFFYKLKCQAAKHPKKTKTKSRKSKNKDSENNNTLPNGGTTDNPHA